MNTNTQTSYFSCQDIHSYYGESYIVQGVSFDINQGEIVALLGRNGAGKTSLLKTIARADEPELKSGGLVFDGQKLHEMSAFEVAKSGICLVPEDRRIIAGLTVEENLKLAQVAQPTGWDLDKIYSHFPRLAERRKQEGITLSGGEQQMLAVARVLARDVKLLLLDEPYEGLAPTIIKEIENILVEIRQLKITTIIVEQNAKAALKISDKAMFMETGKIVYQDTAQNVLENEELRNQYLAI